MDRTVDSSDTREHEDGAGERQAPSKQAPSKQNGHTESNGASAPQAVFTFIQQHPVVAAGGALAVGAAVAMLVHSRRSQSTSLDRRVAKIARNMDRSFTREMRNLRNSDFADRAGRFGSSIGDALSRIDFAPLAERGHMYLDAIASRMKR